MQSLSIAFELTHQAFRKGELFSFQRPIVVPAFSEWCALPARGLNSAQRARLAACRATRCAPYSERSSGVCVTSRTSKQLLTDMGGVIERIEDRLETVSLGADASEYAWLRRRVPRAIGFRALGSDTQPEWDVHPPDPTATQQEFKRALDFVTTTAFRWQDLPLQPPDEEDDDELTAPTVDS
jgi:hypothetical protein